MSPIRITPKYIKKSEKKVIVFPKFVSVVSGIISVTVNRMGEVTREYEGGRKETVQADPNNQLRIDDFGGVRELVKTPMG